MADTYIYSILASNYFDSESFIRLLATLLPFLFTIYLICHIFCGKRFRERWFNFFLINFSAQAAAFVVLGYSTTYATQSIESETMEVIMGFLVIGFFIYLIRMSWKILNNAVSLYLIPDHSPCFCDYAYCSDAISICFLFLVQQARR